VKAEFQILRILVDKIPGALPERVEDLGDDILTFQVAALGILGLQLSLRVFGGVRN